MFIVLICLAAYRYLYIRKYTYRNENGHIWNRCDNCKKAEPTMYWSQKWHGTIYRCDECAFKDPFKEKK